MEPFLIYDLTIYDLRFKCTHFMIEGRRIGLKGQNKYSPRHRPGLGNSSDTVHYRPERPKQIYDLTIYDLNAGDS